MVKRAESWAWSSYPATVGQVTVPARLDKDWVLSQLGGRNPVSAYERFVERGLEQASPWDKLQGQIWLGDEPFLKRMQRLAEGKPVANVPRAHRYPARPNVEGITAAVLSAYGIEDEKRLRSRGHQKAFHAWVYLLRRAANLPLQEVAKRSKVSPSRISKIQRAVETVKPSLTLRRLLDRWNVKH